MADSEPAQKKARVEEESYYKVIDDVKYARDLLENAEEFAKSGLISYAEANTLWQSALDGWQGVTDTEKLTLKRTLTMLKFTDKASTFLLEQLDSETPTSYYKQIDGVKYDRVLLEQAEAFQKDGAVSHAEAKQLWENAMDGKGVMETEKKTLERAMTHFKFTDKASDFMKAALATNISYYKVIDGAKYDSELLEMAERFAKDGPLSLEDAQKLVDSSQDGKGVTQFEKDTLKYTLSTLKYTDEAAEHMNSELEK